MMQRGDEIRKTGDELHGQQGGGIKSRLQHAGTPPPPANPTASCLWHDGVGRFLGFTENQNNPYETANLLNKNKGATVLFCQRKLKIKTFLRTAKPTKRRLPASNPDETTYWLLFKI